MNSEINLYWNERPKWKMLGTDSEPYKYEEIYLYVFNGIQLPTSPIAFISLINPYYLGISDDDSEWFCQSFDEIHHAVKTTNNTEIHRICTTVRNAILAKKEDLLNGEFKERFEGSIKEGNAFEGIHKIGLEAILKFLNVLIEESAKRPNDDSYWYLVYILDGKDPDISLLEEYGKFNQVVNQRILDEYCEGETYEVKWKGLWDDDNDEWEDE
ncbi:hypothetical protein LNTAR_19232 [Lentisphaera araneosa HTCC2155]|uniref:Chromo domain-containing protein n=1 Tax=Lentisphaera araneosa HTCC2155 TaxID=313628 RepID=A6DQP7_9BACT|nr:hypothetical protein [Lentisphaera araneosa]EDM25947.1 hypothetical protein LNTAR_19157 [Lentisphaera araneosa HTCC2155]EDM25962.1 hypothetical protein LNTAR_19232 [Lentisphaera araneosa HTCC2155]